jgi:hypothetical protein
MTPFTNVCDTENRTVLDSLPIFVQGHRLELSVLQKKEQTAQVLPNINQQFTLAYQTPTKSHPTSKQISLNDLLHKFNLFYDITSLELFLFGLNNAFQNCELIVQNFLTTHNDLKIHTKKL